MSTLPQLLANYYRAVLETERIYYENVHKDQPCDREHATVNATAEGEKEKEQSGEGKIEKSQGDEEKSKEESSESKSEEASSASKSKETSAEKSEEASAAPKIVNETLLLQRQLTSLTSQLQDIKHKNEALTEQQKSYKALSETKIGKYKHKIEELKQKLEKKHGTAAAADDIAEADGYHTDEGSKKFDYHLLSPVANRGLKRGLRVTNGASSGNGTIFDSQPGDSSGNDDSDEDISFDGSRTPTHKALGKPRMEHEESFIKALNNDPTAKGKANNSTKGRASHTAKSTSPKRRQLDGVDIPSLNDFSRDEDDSDEAGESRNTTVQFSQVARRQPQKKRKLAKKKINQMSDDSMVVESP
ncbi:Lrs4 protein [Maudiozyma humilis]|uniref:Lrs4 protein n=1 Tax=Maudiozyma humilis TaxID=51915 RepID=A0AAV5S0A7_MAUHU|nr:Lrs4 protein [Kazachstania humilis]